MKKRRHSSHLPVIAAFVGNFVVTLAKFAGFLITGSGSMFSEAIHSFADTANQFLLFVGLQRSQKKASEEHPYGHGRERYIWALISACGIFFLGCGVTVYHGLDVLINGHNFTYSNWAIIILLVSLVIESITLWLAFKEIRRNFPRAKWRTISRDGDPTTLAVLMEDGLAVVGILIAAASIILTKYTGNHYWDAIGSIVIGALLGVVAIVLINKNRHFLITKSIPHKMAEEVKEILLGDPSIEKIYEFKSAVFDADKYLVKCDVEFNASAMIKDLDRHHFIANEYQEVQGDPEEFKKFCVEYMDRVPRLVGKKIDEIEKKIRDRFPEIVFIDIEIN
ncbi:MAG: cation diffusion facilitator family transporter [Candidatus Falkowbacteria bacterium]|nr:cation diffusion facilitator family transporter [Candidatus Falkowbacteria bacterium]